MDCRVDPTQYMQKSTGPSRAERVRIADRAIRRIRWPRTFSVSVLSRCIGGISRSIRDEFNARPAEMREIDTFRSGPAKKIS